MQRVASFLLCFALSASLTIGAIYRVAAFVGAEARPVRLQVLPNLEQRLAALAAHADNPATFRVAYLGDSTVVSYPWKRTVPARLHEQVRREWRLIPRPEVHPVGAVGLSAFEYYFFADRILDARPDLVIMPVHLGSLSESWRRIMRAPELAMWLPAHRVLEALRLPLGWTGLTADRLLFYVALGSIDATDTWKRHVVQQARVGDLRRALRKLAPRWPGMAAEHEFDMARRARRRSDNTLDGLRFTASGALDQIGPVLAGVEPDHPVVEVAAAAVRRFVAADVPVLAYVVPLNVEHFTRLGIYDRERFARSIDTILTGLADAGAEVVDLHDAFPDRMFRDPSSHLAFDGPDDGPVELARTLAPHVMSHVHLRHLSMAR